MKESGQQWDFPNAWAPMQHLLVMGLKNASDVNEEAGKIAKNLAQKWIATNYKAYEQTNNMFEKVRFHNYRIFRINFILNY